MQLEAELLGHARTVAVRQGAATCSRRARDLLFGELLDLGQVVVALAHALGAARCWRGAPPRASRWPRSRAAQLAVQADERLERLASVCRWPGRTAGRPRVANSGLACARSSSISRAARRDRRLAREQVGHRRRRAPPRSRRAATSRGSRLPFSMSESRLPAMPTVVAELVEREPALAAEVPDAPPEGERGRASLPSWLVRIIAKDRHILHTTRDRRS